VTAKVQVSDRDIDASHGRAGYDSERASKAVTPTISTHVLDTETGQPAAGVPVRLGRVLADGAILPVGNGTTDTDGRIDSLPEGELVAGGYRITFEVHQYRARCFYREVSLEVNIDDTARSYHVPLLVAPFGVSSYRGS
jgi:5-hydroxyisourate hydrolase